MQDSKAGQSPPWRDLLVKYCAVVSWAEGVDFLYENEWTPDEWAALQEMLPEVDGMLDRIRAGAEWAQARDVEWVVKS
jgi:hypothetical protein